MTSPKPSTAQLDQAQKRPSVASRHSSGSREQLSTSHQKSKVAHHVVGKRNKSSSHLVKLNKSHSAKNLASKNLKPLTGTRVKRSSSHIKFKVSQDEGEPEEPVWDGPELKKKGDGAGKGKGRAPSEADSGDEASSEGETESSREPSTSRGPPFKRHSILKNSPLVQAATNEPTIQDDMELPGPAQEDTSTRVRTHRMVSFAAEPQISQISNITSHDSTSTAAEEQSEQSGSVEDVADVVDARRQGSRVADAGQQPDSFVEKETFHHQPHTQKSDLAESPGSDQEESVEESPKTQTHQMEITRPRQTTFQLGKRQQHDQRAQESKAGPAQQSIQHTEQTPSEQKVQQAQVEPAPITQSHQPDQRAQEAQAPPSQQRAQEAQDRLSEQSPQHAQEAPSQPPQVESTRHQPPQTTFQLGQRRQPEQRSQEHEDAPSQPRAEATQEAPPEIKHMEAARHEPRQTTFQLGQRQQTEHRSQEAQPQQQAQASRIAQPQPKAQHAQPTAQMPRAAHQPSATTTRSNSNTQTPSRHPTPDHEHNDHPALPLPLHNLASETPLTRPATPISPPPDPAALTSSTNPNLPKSMSRTQYKLAMERQHVLNFRPPRQRPTNAPLPSNLTGQTDSRIDPSTGRVLTRQVCGDAKKDLAALRMITRRDPVCEAIDGLRLWQEWEDREGAWTAAGRAGPGETVKSTRGFFGGRRGGQAARPVQTLSEEEVARKKKFVAFLADGGLQRKLREMWEAPVE